MSATRDQASGDVTSQNGEKNSISAFALAAVRRSGRAGDFAAPHFPRTLAPAHLPCLTGYQQVVSDTFGSRRHYSTLLVYAVTGLKSGPVAVSLTENLTHEADSGRRSIDSFHHLIGKFAWSKPGIAVHDTHTQGQKPQHTISKACSSRMDRTLSNTTSDSIYDSKQTAASITLIATPQHFRLSVDTRASISLETP